MNHPLDRLSAFLDGELPEAERSAIEAHLAECAACSRRLAEYAAIEGATRELPLEAPEGYFEELPGRLRDRLRAEPRPAPALPRRPAWRPPVWGWAAAAALLLGVVTPLLMVEHRPAPALQERAAGSPPAAAPPVQAAPPGLQEQAEPARSQPARPAADAAAPTVPKPAAPTPSSADADRLAALGYLGPQAAGESRQDKLQDEKAKRNESGTLKKGLEQPAAAELERDAPPTDAGKDDAAKQEEAIAFARPPAPEPREMQAAAPAAAASGASAPAEAPAGASLEAKLRAKEAPAPRLGVAGGGRAVGWPELASRPARTVAEARGLREALQAFARENPDDPQADEARVRAVEASVRAYELGRDEADRRVARADASAYLARPDARQRERAQTALARLR